MTKSYTLDDLAQLIDHTNLKPDADANAIKKLCHEAQQYHFKMVAINQVQSRLCAQELADTDVHVGAAIAFPLGQTTIESKLFETKNAIENGADEIDYVINITELKNGNDAYIEKEMTEIVGMCRDNKVISKVIFENFYLTDEEKIRLCQIAKRVQPDFIKTSTGFANGGATIADVKLMKQHVGEQVKVKAAGGIRDAETFIAMIKNGAERIGCSAGIPIIESIKKQMEADHVTTIEI